MHYVGTIVPVSHDSQSGVRAGLAGLHAANQRREQGVKQKINDVVSIYTDPV